MNKLYPKLAATNIKNNGQFYLPYLLTGILSVMMFYCMRAIQGNEGLEQMRGGMQLIMIMTMGTWVIAIFVCIFLFYTNSFIMKRRKKELGVYNILGMEKKHIAKVLFLETLVTYIVSVGGGLILGILFNKFLTMFLYRLTGLESSIQFYISWDGCRQAVELFGAIYLATLIYNFMQIKMANPIELLHGGNTGEKEPKTKIFMTLVGVACIAVAYYIAITTENPMAVLSLFFLAVVLVIIGTYCLFTAGSIAFLKLLKRNKKYYYQTRHFTTVSGMIYRMKQNAVGLANICILSTMVLVMVSTTVSMYVGLDDEINERYPAEIGANVYFNTVPDEQATTAMFESVKSRITESGRIITRQEQIVNFQLVTVLKGNELLLSSQNEGADFANFTIVAVMTKKQYENYTEETITNLADKEVAVASAPDYAADTIEIAGMSYHVADAFSLPDEETDGYNYESGIMYLIVRDDAELQKIYENVSAVYADEAVGQMRHLNYQMEIDIDGTAEEKRACANIVREEIDSWKEDTSMPEQVRYYDSSYVESRQEGYADFVSSNGGLFFLGLFLGVMFLMVTVLIIYYKQISEGYDDRERFAIMEKVGMSNAEVKSAISAQVRTVFFLPLVTAAIHLAAAFPMLKRLLAMLNLTNGTLFICCLAGTVVVFGLIYLVVFILTSKSYYKIVGNQV